MVTTPQIVNTSITMSKHFTFSLRTKKATITVTGAVTLLTTAIMVRGRYLVTVNPMMLVKEP